MTAVSEIFNVSPEVLRAELAADLARGGYVYRTTDSGCAERYFDKFLVLSRPGLVGRSARLLAGLVPDACERLAVTNVAATTLGTALSQQSGLELLLGRERDGDIEFDGELFSHVKVVLVEDVVHTGHRALAGVCALRACDAEIVDAVCLLDRQAGGAQRLSEIGVNLRALFTEKQLLQAEHAVIK